MKNLDGLQFNSMGLPRTTSFRARSSGLQAAYFGAYPLASLGYANWILRHFGYKAVFMFGLSLYGIGALMMWPAALKRSFGGFCGATFVIGSGLGSLGAAANPYITVCGSTSLCGASHQLYSHGACTGLVCVLQKNTGDNIQ